MTQLATPVYAAALPPPAPARPVDNEVRTAALAFVANYAMERIALSRRGQYGKNPLDHVRNIDQECDLPRVISTEQLREMDERGIGSRVNSFWPEECWAADPAIYEKAREDQRTPWESKLDELVDRFNLFEALERLDRESGVGDWGILYFFVDGLEDKATLETPAPGVDDRLQVPTGQAKARNLLYLRVAPRHCVKVLATETNDQSPRFGQPTLYGVTMAGRDGADGHVATETVKVHWTWVIHVPSDAVSSNEWTGLPRGQRSFDYQLNVRKIAASDGEAFYKCGAPGIMFEADGVQAAAAGFTDPLKQEEFKAAVAEYMSGMKRFMLNFGIKANQLTPALADPTAHLEAQLKLIGVTIGVPWRVLVGSEVGQLASDQDTRRVAKRAKRRCEKRCTPRIVRPTLDRFMMVGVLPAVAKYYVDWPDPDSPSDKDKSDIGLKVTQALALYVSSGLSEEMTLRDYLVNVLKWPGDLAKAVEQAALEQIAGAGADAQDNTDGVDAVDGQQGADGNGPTNGTAIDGPPVRQR